MIVFKERDHLTCNSFSLKYTACINLHTREYEPYKPYVHIRQLMYSTWTHEKAHLLAISLHNSELKRKILIQRVIQHGSHEMEEPVDY